MFVGVFSHWKFDHAAVFCTAVPQFVRYSFLWMRRKIMTIFQPLDPRGTGNTFWKLHLRPPGSSSSHTSWQSETEDHFHVPPWQFSVFSLALEGWLLASFVNAFIQESDNFSHCELHFLQLDLAELNIDTIKKRFGAIFSFFGKNTDISKENTRLV